MTLIYNAKCALYKYVWLNFSLHLTGQDMTLELAVWNLRKSFLCFFQSCYPGSNPGTYRRNSWYDARTRSTGIPVRRRFHKHGISIPRLDSWFSGNSWRSIPKMAEMGYSKSTGIHGSWLRNYVRSDNIRLETNLMIA